MESEFRFRHPLDVRFSDIDVAGNVHHSRALVYFEEARWAYWGSVVGRGSQSDVDYTLAEINVRYHRRIHFPARLDVGARVSSMGRKRFVMRYEVVSEGGEILVSGESTQVMFDYDSGDTMLIPEEVRAAIEAWESDVSEAPPRRDETFGSE
ncbi:MAG: thioesterase family protein [Gemmatimonadota bacterium]|nr:MAG: thioesterase family protein [Gemmatimonadota bacterium]